MAKVLGVLVSALVVWALTATAVLAEEGRWQPLENNPSCVVWNPYPQPNETVVWSGACANGKAHGRGTLVWRHLQQEERYEGEFWTGKKHGRGVLVWANGDRYNGDFSDGELHGRGV